MDGWPHPGTPPLWTSPTLPPFVGRERELQVLEALWPRVVASERQLLVVGGDAGAGKSRLATEAAVALGALGVPVLFGACSRDVGEPFDPWAGPVHALLPSVYDGTLTLDPDVPEEALALLERVAGAPRADGAPSSEPPATDIVAEAVTAVLAAACLSGPLLLVLDDLHWAGSSALALLRLVVERTAELPLLIVVTMRATPPDRSSELVDTIGDLFRFPGVTRVDLAGLDTEAIAEYLSRGRRASSPELRRLAALLRDRTGGNPFLLRELCRDTPRDLAGTDIGSMRAPDGLRAVVATRLATLTATHREIVRAAAVAGDEVDVRLLAAATGQAPAVVLEAVARARAVGLLEPGEAGVHRFPHTLAREAVSDTLDEEALARDHARIGVAIESGFPALPARDARLGHHFARAVGHGLEGRAARHLAAAGDVARARLANAEAAGLYEQAAALAATADERDTLHLRAAQCLHFAGRSTRAMEVAEQVALTGSPALRLRAATGYEGASWRTATPGDRSVRLLTAALAETPPDSDDPWYVRALAGLGRAHAYTGNVDRGTALCAEAVAHARRIGDPGLLASVLQASLQDGPPTVHLEERLARADELTALVEGSGEYHRMGAAAFHRCVAHYVLGDPEALRSAHVDLARAARNSGQVYWVAVFATVDASLALLRGDADAARAGITRARVATERIQPGRADGAWGLQSFVLRREYGGLAAARALLSSAPSVARDAWPPGLVALYTELGMLDEARARLRQVLGQGLAGYRPSSSWPAVLAFLTEAAVHTEDLESARLLLPLAREQPERLVVGGEMLAPFGSGHRLVGMLASVVGEPDATESLELALDVDRRMGFALSEATSEIELARHLARVGAPATDVRRARARARELADLHGFVRVERLLGPDPAAAAAGPDGLTRRELEVLVLLGRGASNREIAASLVISEHTAANHVRSILQKTGCSNRTRAARYALDAGLTGSGYKVRPTPGGASRPDASSRRARR